jgi:CubicO group peptidase (beta-lactamase class C family)
MDKPPAFESGGAGLVSTIDDYEKFGRMLLQGGRLGDTRILSKKTVEFLTSGTLTPSQQKSMDEWSGLEGHTYSHLMRRVVEPGNACGLTIKGEYGWDGWLGCYFANFPSEDMTMLIMQQKKDSGTISLTRKIRNLVLSNM